MIQKHSKHTKKLIIGFVIVFLAVLGISPQDLVNFQTETNSTNQLPPQPSPLLEANQQVGFVVDIVDGDTIKAIVNEKQVTVRLIGIDAPEQSRGKTPAQCLALESTQKLSSLILNRYVILEQDKNETDRYGRLLRYVYIQNNDALEFINTTMIKEGLARAKAYPPDTKYQDVFNSNQTQAKNDSLGVWSKNCQKWLDISEPARNRT